MAKKSIQKQAQNLNTKELSPQQIINRAQGMKMNFAASNGQQIQKMADNISDMTNGFLKIIDDLLQEREGLKMQLAQMHKGLEEANKKTGNQQPKKIIQETETEKPPVEEKPISA